MKVSKKKKRGSEEVTTPELLAPSITDESSVLTEGTSGLNTNK